jgi:hypothetical protein
MPDEVKDELDTMACNEDTVRLVYVNLYWRKSYLRLAVCAPLY